MKQLTIISMSGGLDSATLCAEALYRGHDVFVINFNYNQKNVVETKAFENLINYFQNNYQSNGKIIGIKKLNLKPLFDEFLNIWAQMRDSGEMKRKTEHQFYTPSRNLLFAVMSAVIGEIIALTRDYEQINIGLGIHQHSHEAYGEHRNYWDITPQFAKKLQEIFNLNDVVKIKVFAPFVDKFKEDIVRRALEFNVPYKLTWTCYNPSIKEGVAIPCLQCEACIERQRAGELAGVDDINTYHVILND